MALNYSRWDNLDVSDDDGVEEPAAQPPPWTPPGKDSRSEAVERSVDRRSKCPDWLCHCELNEKHFEPKSQLRQGDWLSGPGIPDRPGQTYEQFERDHLERWSGFAGPRPSKIHLVPIGPVNGIDCDQLVALVRSWFGLPIVCTAAIGIHQLVNSGMRTNERGEDQILTSSVLDFLRRWRKPAGVCCAVGFTMVDLYPDPRWNFVFGQADVEHGVGVFSFARHRGVAGRSPLWRSCQVLVHELGHLFRMDHCVFYQCAMNGSNHLDESDATPLRLCPICLRKLLLAVGHVPAARSPRERYARLLDFYDGAGESFQEEAEWTRARIAECDALASEDTSWTCPPCDPAEEAGRTKTAEDFIHHRPWYEQQRTAPAAGDGGEGMEPGVEPGRGSEPRSSRADGSAPGRPPPPPPPRAEPPPPKTASLLSCEELRSLDLDSPALVVVDVREERVGGHLPGSWHTPSRFFGAHDLLDDMRTLAPSAMRIVLHCDDGKPREGNNAAAFGLTRPTAHAVAAAEQMCTELDRRVRSGAATPMESAMAVSVLSGGFDEWYAEGHARCSCEAGACSKIEEMGPAIPSDTGPPLPPPIAPEQWLRCTEIKAHAKYRIVYFGWAGNRCGRGSDCGPLSPRNWSHELADYEIYEVMLPGRGGRVGEPCATSVFAIARALAASISAALHQNDPKPYCFVGFAFGAIIAYETALEISEHAGPITMRPPEEPHKEAAPTDRPLLLTAISSESPRWADRRTSYHRLDDEAFVAELRERGGTTELLDAAQADPSLLPIFLPVVKADVALEETYSPDAHRWSPVPTLVVRGAKPGPRRGDSLLTMAHAKQWEKASKDTKVVTLDDFDWFMLENAHAVPTVLQRITERFMQCLAWDGRLRFLSAWNHARAGAAERRRSQFEERV
jgi:archaemetzincin